MAKKTFDLGDTLADVLGKVSESDRPVEQIVLISLPLIDADEKNFYSLDGIQELAANIELVGLLDPLRVRENPNMPGRFLIVSGHRRRAALWTLYEEDPDKWGKAPCIVEQQAASPELQELRLIYANADTRKMTSADLSAQAQRVETLLYDLKEQGVEFPGRMRDHVAEICKVNATKLAELKVIREKLIHAWSERWENNKISHACAYKLAQQDEKVQELIFTAANPDNITECRVEGSARTISKLLDRKCDELPIGTCTYAKDLMKIEFGPGYHGCANYSCCKKCPNLITCKDSCPNVADVKAEMKAAKKAARAVEIKAEKARSAELEGITRKIWTRFGELRREKGLSAKEITKLRGDQFYPSYHGEEWHEQMEGPDAKITEHTAVPWTNSMQADDVEKLIKTADAFGVSCDYLLGRTDERRPWGSEWTSVEDHYPEEGTYVWAVDKFGTVLPSVYFRAAFMDFTPKSVGNERLKHIEWWMAMPAPPPGMKYIGQETIQKITEGRK